MIPPGGPSSGMHHMPFEFFRALFSFRYKLGLLGFSNSQGALLSFLVCDPGVFDMVPPDGVTRCLLLSLLLQFPSPPSPPP